MDSSLYLKYIPVRFVSSLRRKYLRILYRYTKRDVLNEKYLSATNKN